MHDYYQLPALLLTVILLPSFGYLYLRFRDTRSLLWFLGFFCAVVRMALFHHLGRWDFQDGSHPWALAAGQTSIQIGSALFLASLSPLSFRVGRFRVLYVIPYTVPLVVYSLLFHGIFKGHVPVALTPQFAIFPLLGGISLIVACNWAAARGSMPVWLSVAACMLLGGSALWVCFHEGTLWPLTLVECGNQFMTALLLIFVFRRFSPGMVLGVFGFLLWSLSILFIFPGINSNEPLDVTLTRMVVMGKVVAAMGMILLSLEDQLNANRAAEERERRSRRELEAYANLILSRRRIDDFDRQAAEICQTVAAQSRFAQAALLLLHSSGRYRLAGAAGLDDATMAALDSMAQRIPVADFLTPGSAPFAVEHSQTLKLDLDPWLAPGDDLKRLHFTQALAVPLPGRAAMEGVLLLAGLRNSYEPLRAEDLLPVEMLAGRLQAVRSHTTMLEKLIDSEKFASLGQLAGNVTQQLNNPLTVILGYASLLEETPVLEPHERRGVEAILAEARRMRSTLESLSRISRPQDGHLTPVSVAELLTDMERLYGPEFLRRGIEFRVRIAPGLPRVMADAQQLRQAVLHCLQFAMEAVDNLGPEVSVERTIRLEAAADGSLVRIRLSHSGPGFLHPERAFDPFVPAQATGDTSGLGLSLCATILRDQHGQISAANIEPQGASILLELQAA